MSLTKNFKATVEFIEDTLPPSLDLMSDSFNELNVWLGNFNLTDQEIDKLVHSKNVKGTFLLRLLFHNPGLLDSLAKFT